MSVNFLRKMISQIKNARVNRQKRRSVMLIKRSLLWLDKLLVGVRHEG